MEPTPQQLYRLYDDEGQLLYIGISYSAIARYAQHKVSQPWVGDVTRIEIETHHCTRREIEVIERDAIRFERPIHNVIHNAVKAKTDLVQPVEFDSTPFLQVDTWRESWAAACEALDYFARDLDYSYAAGYDSTPGRATMIEAVNGVIRSLIYGDCCNKCMEIRYPMALKYESPSWVRCAYVCIPCKHQWGCGWAADLKVVGSVR